MQPDGDQIRSGDGSFPPEDDALLRQPVDEGVDDPDTELHTESHDERPGRPDDPAEGPDDEDYTDR